MVANTARQKPKMFGKTNKSGTFETSVLFKAQKEFKRLFRGNSETSHSAGKYPKRYLGWKWFLNTKCELKQKENLYFDTVSSF